MKIVYDPEVDVLRILFHDTTIAESDEDDTGMIFDYDKQSNLMRKLENPKLFSSWAK